LRSSRFYIPAGFNCKQAVLPKLSSCAKILPDTAKPNGNSPVE
jgi:hypothetical protein